MYATHYRHSLQIHISTEITEYRVQTEHGTINDGSPAQLNNPVTSTLRGDQVGQHKSTEVLLKRSSLTLSDSQIEALEDLLLVFISTWVTQKARETLASQQAAGKTEGHFVL